ncbi:MAG: hypothetical protein WC346_12925 [Methanogenium sp.]|jgi:hypothetical protein
MKQEESAFDIMAKELSSVASELTDEELEVIENMKTRTISKEEDENTEDEEIDTETETDESEEEETEEDEELDKEDKKEKKETKEDDDLGEFEEDITKFVKNKIENKLGISLSDSSKIEDIVDELSSMVEESTKNLFANEEVEEINEYVRNGGDLKKFFSESYSSGVDLDVVDLDSVSDQKRIMKEHLKNRGYSDAQIERKLDRYEDSGVLQEEAEEAVESIKEYRELKKKELLETQQKQAEAIKKRNEVYINNVQKSIKELDNVYGLTITDKDRKDLYKYMLSPEADGKTKLQKEAFEDPKKFVVYALLTMKGDAIVKKALTKGASNTAKSLKDKLSQKGNRVKRSNTKEGEVSGLSAFAAMLRK